MKRWDHGEREEKTTSRARLAFNAQVAALQFDQAACDRQAQASALRRIVLLAQAKEGLKHAFALLWWNAGPGVANVDPDKLSDLMGRHFDFSTVWCELDGIPQEVHQNLLEARGIGPDAKIW